jgi:hypothetical protein
MLQVNPAFESPAAFFLYHHPSNPEIYNEPMNKVLQLSCLFDWKLV